MLFGDVAFSLLNLLLEDPNVLLHLYRISLVHLVQLDVELRR